MKSRNRTGRDACRRSPCPAANALDLLGDKWSLLVVRDLMFLGKRRYNELLASPEGIPSNILAERLRRLERAGLLRKTLYRQRPRRYEYHLTSKGQALQPVFQALMHWASRHLPNTAKLPRGFFDKIAG